MKHVARETRDAIVVSFEIPAHEADRFRFTQGQFLTLKARLDGEDVRRSYSICSPAHEPELRIAIKRVADGRFSAWAFDALVPGATIEVAPPSGRFFIDLDPHHQRNYLAFAAGSGITPVLSIIATTLALEPHSSFTLVYGNRSTSHVMFASDLQNLKDRYLGRLALIFIMSREQQDVELFAGRIDRAKCDALFDSWIDISTIHTTFVCGPEDMTLAVKGALEDHGVDASAVKTELFAAGPRGARRVSSIATATAPQTVQASVVLDGRTRTFEIEKGVETVLDAGLRAGIDLPYSCKGGVCSTCRCLLRSGEVEMDVHYALEDYEIRRGFILPCQSYPLTDSLELDLDGVRE